MNSHFMADVEVLQWIVQHVFVALFFSGQGVIVYRAGIPRRRFRWGRWSGMRTTAPGYRDWDYIRIVWILRNSGWEGASISNFFLTI